MMFHAKDDPYVPYRSVKRFADSTGAELTTFRTGGHISTEFIVKTQWIRIKTFFDSD
jgi:predicted alpha/beta hydrolase family esterase